MRRPALRIAVTILTIVSALIMLASFGTNLPPSPFDPISLDNPIAADTNGDVTVIADTHARRLLVLDSEERLTQIISFSTLNPPIDTVSRVCVADGYIYVAGNRNLNDTDLIVSERIVRYNRHGNDPTVVYETQGDAYVLGTSIASIDDMGSGVVIAISALPDENGQTDLSFLHVDHDRQLQTTVAADHNCDLPVFDAGYNSTTGQYVEVNYMGAVDTSSQDTEAAGLNDHAIIAADVTEDGDIIVIDDDADCISRITPSESIQFQNSAGFEYLQVNGKHVCACDRNMNVVRVYDLSGNILSEFSDVPLDPALTIHVCVAWTSRAFLALLLLYYVVKTARQIVAGSIQGFGAVFASTAVVIAIATAIGYSSYGSRQTALEIREHEIATFADYLDMTSSSLTSDFETIDNRMNLRRSSDRIEQSSKALTDIQDTVGSLCFSANANGIGTYFTAYGKDEQGIFILYDSASENIVGASDIPDVSRPYIEEAFVLEAQADKLIRGISLRDETRSHLVSIPSSDGKSIVGVIEIGTRAHLFESSIRNMLVENVISLLVILLVVYIAYLEIRECGHCLLTYRQLQRENVRDAIAVLTRPFSFLVTTLSSIDAVMSTLIAKALLQGTEASGNGILLALPAAMLGFGMAIGHVVYGFLGPRVELRKLMTRGAAIMTLGALGATAAVGLGSFWLYCATKLAMAIPFGLLYTLEYSLPRRAETPEIQTLAAGGIKRTDTSAAAFGTVLGAYAAQNLGNAWVYVVMAMVSVAVMSLALLLFPANGKPLERLHTHTERTRLARKRFLRDRATIADALLIMVPATFAVGYNSFLFPLYSSDVGLDTSTINNVCVLGQLIVLVTINLLDVVEAKRGRWRVSISAIALLGATFLLFSLNRTIGWAVAAIAFVGVFKKATDGWKPMWIASAHEHGVPTGEAIGIMFATSSIALMVRPVVLGALVAFGVGASSLALGCTCLVSAIAFRVITRRTAVSKV